MYLRVSPLSHFSSKVARIPIPSSRLGVPVKTYLYSLLVEQVTMARLCCSDEKWSRSMSCRSKSTSNHAYVCACLLNDDFTRRSNVDVLSFPKRITGKRLLDKLNIGTKGRRGWSQWDAVQKLSDRIISHHEDCLVLRRLWPQISRAGNFSLDRKKELSWPSVPILHPLLTLPYFAIHLCPEHRPRRRIHEGQRSWKWIFSFFVRRYPRVLTGTRVTRFDVTCFQADAFDRVSDRSCIICHCCQFIDTRTNVIRFHTAGWTNVNYCWHIRRRPRRFCPSSRILSRIVFSRFGDSLNRYGIRMDHSLDRSIT